MHGKRRRYPMRHGAPAALKHIFGGILALRKHEVYGKAFKKPEGKFPIDGRLVGDIGDAIAALDYRVVLHEKQKKGTDGTYGKRDVQVKATFQDKITFPSIPPTGIHILCFQLHKDGSYTELYNGPSELLLTEHWEQGTDRLWRPSADELLKLASGVDASHRIPRVSSVQ